MMITAKHFGDSLPKPIRSLMRMLRNSPTAAPRLLQPMKWFRTFAYHIGVYRITRRTVYGLHLGSGDLRIRDFINLDTNAFANCDLISGILKLKFSDESVGTIYASHVFEHVPRAQIQSVLREWHRILKPGAKLFMCVPDLEKLAQVYLQYLPDYPSDEAKYNVDLAAGIIYGGQSNKYDFHFFGYSFLTLKALLIETGFREVNRFDQNTPKFAPTVDSRYAEIRDVSVSLNIVASK